MKTFNISEMVSFPQTIDKRRPASLVCFLILAFIFIPSASFPNQIVKAKVVKVLDGDSFVLEGERQVRILGIDTPEFGQPFSEKSKARTEKLILGKIVNIYVCKENPKDKYGRILGIVKIGNTDVGYTLVSEGLAFCYILPPCGLSLAKKCYDLSNKAEKDKIGIWTSREITPIKAQLAAEAIDKRRTVEGVVLRGFKSKNGNVFLNFGPNYKTDFTIFIYKTCLPNFSSNGIDPTTFYKDKLVRVRGPVIEYNGPEIKVCHPYQIEVRDKK